MRHFFVTLILLIVGGTLSGQDRYETILLPLAVHRDSTMGAHGSMWRTEFVIFNGNPVDLEPNGADPDIYPLWDGCGFPACPGAQKVSSGRTYEPLLWARRSAPFGLLLHVKREFADRLTFNLRVRDVSRDAFNWGTEVPVVRESHLRTETTRLPNVPFSDRFRVALRLMDPDSRPAAALKLRILSPEGAEIDAAELRLVRPDSSACDVAQVQCFPASAEILDLAASFPVLRSVPVATLEIEPLTAGLRFWGFAAITNNETQHVTLVSPQ